MLVQEGNDGYAWQFIWHEIYWLTSTLLYSKLGWGYIVTKQAKQAPPKLLLPKNFLDNSSHLFFASLKRASLLLAWQHFHCILHKSWWCRCQLGSFHGHFSGLFTLCLQAFENNLFRTLQGVTFNGFLLQSHLNFF